MIIYDIVYDIEYNSTDIVYDIGIPINMEDYGLVVSYVHIVPLIYLTCVLKKIQVDSVPSEEWEGFPKPGRGLLD